MKLGRNGFVPWGVAGVGSLLFGLSLWEASSRLGWSDWQRDSWEGRWASVQQVTNMAFPEPQRLLVGLGTGPPSSWLAMNVPIGSIRVRYVQQPFLRGSCAVVGSSGNLRHWDQGSAIDSHDYVLRLNLAPTEGYEKDVGARTTHVIANKNFIRMSLGGKKSLKWKGPRQRGVEYWVDALSLGHQITDRLERVTWLEPVSPDRLKWLSMPLGQRLQILVPGARKGLSTGLKSIFLAIHLCDSVGLFGFGADPDGRWDYYFKTEWSDSHNEKWEADLIQKIESLPFVHFHAGNVLREFPVAISGD